MEERNMMCTGQAIDLELDQPPPGPSVPFGRVANFPQQHIHTVFPAVGNNANVEIDFLQGSHENALFSTMMQYNVSQHHHPSRQHDLDVSAAYNSYHPCMIPSGPRVLPLPIIQGPHNQLPPSINGGIFGVPTNGYSSNNHFTDSVGDSFKRKISEGILGSFQYQSDLASSSSASFPFPGYRGNDTQSLIDVGTYGSVRSRLGASGPETALTQNPSHSIQANRPVQTFQTAGSPWLDQQFSYCGEGGSLTLSETSAATYMQGVNTASNRSPATFLHHPPTHQGHPFHCWSQPLVGPRVQNINAISQIAMSARRFSVNGNSHTGMEVGPGHVGPVPLTGIRMYRPHRRAHLPQATMRHRNLPSLRILPADEVAMLEFSGYYEVRDSTDHHSDMRLDIDNMSYEELLALGERIGNVGTGLSEEAILTRLKTRTYITSSTSAERKETPCVDQETDFCVICQTDYKNWEKIGTLDCGHEYHADCVKEWLLIKNSCPICKSSGLVTERKD